MRETFPKTRPVLLEPVMRIEIECPSQFQGSVVGNLTSRRGLVVAAEVHGPDTRIEGEVPLAETFGYSTDLRSLTQGQGTFTMEFARYKRLPKSLEEEVIAEAKRPPWPGPCDTLIVKIELHTGIFSSPGVYAWGRKAVTVPVSSPLCAPEGGAKRRRKKRFCRPLFPSINAWATERLEICGYQRLPASWSRAGHGTRL